MNERESANRLADFSISLRSIRIDENALPSIIRILKMKNIFSAFFICAIYLALQPAHLAQAHIVIRLKPILHYSYTRYRFQTKRIHH